MELRLELKTKAMKLQRGLMGICLSS